MTHHGLDGVRVSALIDERFAALGGTLGPRLRAGYDALLARQKWGAAHPGWYTAAESQPILVLVLQMASALGDAVPRNAVEDALESAMIGYAYVRVQDDWLDDEVLATDPETTALLADALFARHQAVTARVVGGGDETYWDLSATTWAAYGEAMLLERELLRGPALGAPSYDAEAFEAVLLRSRPMVLPPAALLARAGLLQDRLPALQRLVHEVARASQLLDDALDVLADFDAGSMNYLVQRFGGLHGRAALAAGFALGGFATAWEEADAALTEALDASRALGMAEQFAGFVAARRAVMTRVRDAAYGPPGQ
jgi:hypothetical protein